LAPVVGLAGATGIEKSWSTSTGGGTGVDTVVVLISPIIVRASLLLWYILRISSLLLASSALSSIRSS
jgi:hypothetical protein